MFRCDFFWRAARTLLLKYAAKDFGADEAVH
jgi:hypothetical protein